MLKAREAVEPGVGNGADAVVGVGSGQLGRLGEHLHPGVSFC
jgi:hypothetical protein